MDQPRPQWIAKMYPSKVGRDHLGLGSVSSDQILPSLSPAINVLTYHPRYYSFYVFLLDEFWLRDRPRSTSAWVDFYRPREFVFSLGGTYLLITKNILSTERWAKLSGEISPRG